MNTLKTLLMQCSTGFKQLGRLERIGIIFSLITCLAGIGFAVLLFFIRGISHDEIYSLVCTMPQNTFKALMDKCIMTDANPPLYLWLLYLYNTIAFINWDLWVRVPSFICAVAAVLCGWFCFPKQYGLTRRIIFNTLVFCSAYFLLFMIGARSYSLMYLLSLLITFLAFNFFDDIGQNKIITKKRIWLFNILGIILCFSHYYGAVLFVLLAVLLIGYCLKQKQSAWRGFAFGLFGVLFVYAFWLLPSYAHLKNAGIFDGKWWGNKNAPWVASTEFFDIAFTADATQYFLFALIALAFIKYKHNPKDNAVLLVPGFLFCMVYFSLYIISFKINMMQGRYFIVLLPVLYLFVSFALEQLFKKTKYSIILWCVFLALAMWGNIKFLQKHAHDEAESKTFALKYMADYPGKTILLASNYQFSDTIVEEVFSYYLTVQYKQPVKFINILNKDAAAQTLLLADKNAIVYMPGCDERGRERLYKKIPVREIYRNHKKLYCLFAKEGADAK